MYCVNVLFRLYQKVDRGWKSELKLPFGDTLPHDAMLIMFYPNYFLQSETNFSSILPSPGLSGVFLQS